MYFEVNQATRAASFAAGAEAMTSILKATSLKDILEVLKAGLEPKDSHNGMILDQDSFHQGLLIGMEKVEEVVASNQEMEWLSQSSEIEPSDVESAIMEGYFGA